MASMLHSNETVPKGLVAVMQVEGSAGSEGEEEVQESPHRILAAVGNKQSPVVSWSARQSSCRASLSPQSNRQVYPACHQCLVMLSKEFCEDISKLYRQPDYSMYVAGPSLRRSVCIHNQPPD